MSRIGMAVAAMIFLVCGSIRAETIGLTRVDNGYEQFATSWAQAGGYHHFAPTDPDYDPEEDEYSASSMATKEYVNGFNIGNASDYTDATCNTLPGVTAYAPSVQAITGGPIVVTGTSGQAFAATTGDGASDAYFVVGEPEDPDAVLTLHGTITIAASPGTHTVAGWSTTVTVGGSTITCTAAGCSGVIQDPSYPGGSYTVSSPYALGGTWNFSQVVAKGSTIHMQAKANYGQTASVPCSEYPDFSAAASMSVDAP